LKMNNFSGFLFLFRPLFIPLLTFIYFLGIKKKQLFINHG
jgi:hypothetical protein